MYKRNVLLSYILRITAKLVVSVEDLKCVSCSRDNVLHSFHISSAVILSSMNINDKSATLVLIA